MRQSAGRCGVQAPPQVGRSLAADNLLESLKAGRAHAVDRAEAREQAVSPLRPDARDRHELGREPPRPAAPPVTGDREAVRLIAHPLQQQAHGVVGLQQQRPRAAGKVDLLDALGERGGRQPAPGR